MRIFFIPGFGEEAWIFDKISPHIPGEKVFIDNWQSIGERQRADITALAFASELVVRYGITSEDLVIGHSMGGWIAYHIKHMLQCPIVQIASWTDERKVVKLMPNQALMDWCVKRGLIFNRLVLRYLLRKSYKGKASAEVFKPVFERLIEGPRENVVNQLRVVNSTAPDDLTVAPDLRIHARRDPIIRFPDQPALEVPGDHFTLWTHPESVYLPIVSFVKGLATKEAER